MTPIPQHLTDYDWYAPHLAWLASIGITPRHDPGDAVPKRVDLRDADLRYTGLNGADLCGANFSRAQFYGASLSGANLHGAKLRDADISRASLRRASLSNADLRYTNLNRADISGAFLSGAIGLPEAPVMPDIDAAILTAIEQDGCSLDMGDWHTCGTTHCRAGWAITLAGEEGAELEHRFGPSVAGALIYAASRPDQPVPDWYATNEEAIADMRQRAGVTA